MTVLVLTQDLDPTADLVIHELNQRGTPLIRLDPGTTSAITAELDADGWRGRIVGQHRDTSLGGIRAVYHRRPTAIPADPTLDPVDAAWTRAQARSAVDGLLDALACPWVNHPARNKQAGNKAANLAAAVRCGLTVPRTVITTDPSVARDFVTGLGGTAACKPLASAPVETDGERHVIWTSRITTAQVTDAVAACPHLFQEWIPKAFEVRVTAVGNRLFAAEIHAQSDAARVDFRSDYDNLTYRAATVPDTVAAGIHRLLAHYRLRYAAMDFLVNTSGDWFFVDLNPGGQFGFVPDLRQPIAAAIADLLEGQPS